MTFNCLSLLISIQLRATTSDLKRDCNAVVVAREWRLNSRLLQVSSGLTEKSCAPSLRDYAITHYAIALRQLYFVDFFAYREDHELLVTAACFDQICWCMPVYATNRWDFFFLLRCAQVWIYSSSHSDTDNSNIAQLLVGMAY